MPRLRGTLPGPVEIDKIRGEWAIRQNDGKPRKGNAKIKKTRWRICRQGFVCHVPLMSHSAGHIVAFGVVGVNRPG